MCLAFFLETKARSWGAIKETISLDWWLQGLLCGPLRWSLNGRLLGIVGGRCLEWSLQAVGWSEIVMCLGSWIPHQKITIKQPE